MGSKIERKGLIARLLKDTMANTMAISAAAVIPLVGVIGGGVDASRMYMAKSRLQQACDSATLAARKQLGATEIDGGNIPSDVSTQADNFFEANFRQGTYGTTDTDYTLTSSVGTRMDGTASTKIPTTLMGVFGYDEVDIDVDCSADLNLPNIDIVLVLDNSGSMRDSRIVALRTAVFGFYDEIMAVKPSNARVRMGIVPYNASVNVGQMLNDLDPNYLTDAHDYQSREAIFETVMTDPGSDGDEEKYSDQVELLPRSEDDFGSSNINKYRWHTNPNNNNIGYDACNDMDGTYYVGDERWVVTSDDWLQSYFNSGNSNRRSACEGRVKKYRNGDPIPPTYEEVFQRYEYKEMSFNTSSFKTFSSVGTPTGTQGANVNSTWNGCIEEATTVATTNFDPIPAGANDLNIDLIPSSGDPDTQWRPMWPQITYDRGGPAQVNSTSNYSTRGYSCPVRAWPMQEYPLAGGSRDSDFEARINGMQTHGFTMHDIGMIWAGRMMSPDGIYGATNTTAPNGEPITRHVIFMTDGYTEPGPWNTSSYGNYDMDGHFAGFAGNGVWTTAQLQPIHNSRLVAVCQQIKNKNATIWTVTFGLAQNAHTTACASGSSRALESDNSAELISNFRSIATSIAELRLVK